MNISPWVEVCPPDRHVYYTAFLSYLFCPIFFVRIAVSGFIAANANR